MTDFRSSIQETMKTVRIESEMTVGDFADLLGVTESYVYMLESGKRAWSNILVEKVFEKLSR